MSNPVCTVCGEVLQSVRVGDAVFDYVPSPPALMRVYLALYGPDAPIFECFGFGCSWQPALPSPFGTEPGQAPAG